MYEAKEIIGTLAAILTTLAFIPQAVHVIKTQDTKSLSLSMYVMFFTGVLLWLVYGIMNSDYPLIVANSITGLLAFTILVVKIKNQIYTQ
jgi:MtN3 and saliva related transmembrane protein